MAGIFISYRREDSSHAAGRLVDRLAQVFPREQLFMDVDAIEPGLDFLKVIDAKLAECDVLLAVIGPNWADARDADGVRRLDDPDDLVRLELEAALSRDIRVIPVLVGALLDGIRYTQWTLPPNIGAKKDGLVLVGAGVLGLPLGLRERGLFLIVAFFVTIFVVHRLVIFAKLRR